MVLCEYCNGLVIGGSTGSVHGECHAEWERRSYNGICTKCGSNKARPYGWCAGCTVHSPHVGYRRETP